MGMALLMAGCAGPEQKLGRGINNMTEIVRMGELRRSIEQTSVLDNPSRGFTTGAIHGMDRSLTRTAYGLYEVATFPIPNHKPKNYGPIFLSEGNPKSPYPVFPDSYTPNWLSDQMMSPDTSLGFGGGDVVPFVPGSRFRIFDN